jgi:hypothetical protein
MKLYHYDPVSLVYTGQSDAREDPLEPGRHLVPRFATLRVIPPLVAGQRAVFNPALDTWTVQLDLPPDPVPNPDPLPTLAQQAATLAKNVDLDVDQIYRDVVGNRTQEYLAAEQQARAFADAGFTGTVPPSVQSWVAASGMTAEAAATDILAKATAWNGARETIRAQRLLAKAGALAAADEAALATVMTGWAGFVSNMRAALGV